MSYIEVLQEYQCFVETLEVVSYLCEILYSAENLAGLCVNFPAYI